VITLEKLLQELDLILQNAVLIVVFYNSLGVRLEIGPNSKTINIVTLTPRCISNTKEW
jgi:hypothetical protein